MALPHLNSGEKINLLPLGDKLEQTPTSALFKDPRLEVMRVVLLAGKSMPEHAVAGPITLHCIEGKVEISAENACTLMTPGDLMYLAGGVPHALHAVDNTSVLVTVALL